MYQVDTFALIVPNLEKNNFAIALVTGLFELPT